MKIEELFSVRGKVAVVTGGSRGLGEMIARAHVENGVKVYITARRAEACEQLAKELSVIGECIAIPADLSRMEEIDRFAARSKSGRTSSTFWSTMPAPVGAQAFTSFRRMAGTRSWT
jgi:NAD(P)-dependent dehydrogenase (short-subunit alcohol dehydrogenase family)